MNIDRALLKTLGLSNESATIVVDRIQELTKACGKWSLALQLSNNQVSALEQQVKDLLKREDQLDHEAKYWKHRTDKAEKACEEMRILINGCGNHGCFINPPKGMATNGPCECGKRIREYLKEKGK